MTVTDDDAPSARNRPRWLLLGPAITVLLLVIWALVATSDAGDDSGRSETAARSSGVSVVAASDGADRTSATTALLDAQQQALTRGDRTAFLQDWASEPASQRTAHRIFTNLSRLGADVDLRLVTTGRAITEVDPVAAWQVRVDAEWRLPGVSTRAAVTTLQYSLKPDEDGSARVSAVRAVSGGLAPLWLAERLHVRYGAGWIAAAGSADIAGRLARELPAVLRDVRDVVPGPSTAVVVYAPSDLAAMKETIGNASLEVEQVAGVAASVDGSTGRRAPVAVVLNPDQFERLGQRGRTAVLAHEVTHAVTGAAGVVRMPLWLAEGFADYVGLRAAEVPLGLAGRVALRDVREHGVPAALPDDDAFVGGGGRRLELAYEQAWLAVRSLADRFGEPALVGLYQQMVAHPHEELSRAVRTELAISLEAVTRWWQADLRELAHG